MGLAALAATGGVASLMGSASAIAAGTTVIKATHGAGLCNLGIFLAKERKLTEAEGVVLEFVVTPNEADVVTMFGAGLVDVSVLPYSNFMTLVDQGVPVTLVGGAGAGGCFVVAAPGITTPEQLKGKTVGTFQANTLEVLLFDYLEKSGVSFGDVSVKYFSSSPELAAAFISGAVDAISHVEPYASQCVQERAGSTILTDGLDLYSANYPDCVLAARTPLIEENPAAVKAVIKGMMTAQLQSEQDVDAALQDVVGTYYKTTLEALKMAQGRQPVMIDQRHNTEFFKARSGAMKAMGYVKNALPDSAVSWVLLEEVIAENPDLFGALKLKSA